MSEILGFLAFLGVCTILAYAPDAVRAILRHFHTG